MKRLLMSLLFVAVTSGLSAGDLIPLTFPAGSRVVAMNEGLYGGAVGNDPAFFYNSGGPGKFEGFSPGLRMSILGMSSQMAAGQSLTGTPMVWNMATGVYTELSNIGGFATDVNESGVVVGSVNTPEGAPSAFVYQGGVFTPLGTFGALAATAVSINNQNQIAINLTKSGGVRSGVVYDMATGTLTRVIGLGGNTLLNGISDEGKLSGKTGGVVAIGKPNDMGQYQMVALSLMIPPGIDIVDIQATSAGGALLVSDASGQEYRLAAGVYSQDFPGNNVPDAGASAYLLGAVLPFVVYFGRKERKFQCG
ncbi:MAG: hypothetical protein NTV72_01525 [Candidatus Taylorbacteria bacterium]|nr:hypothetical protein [Candidatus Taylorbacteria bacterium]